MWKYRIELTKGQFALVSKKDYERLSKYKWYARWSKCTQSYYATRSVRLPNGKQTPICMHREILRLKRGDKRQGDHINHDTLDNRRCNVRIVTASENMHNRKKEAKGYHKHRNKYQAQIWLHDKIIYLGLFDTPDAAHQAYLDAKEVYHPTAPSIKKKRLENPGERNGMSYM